jgi:hypothetical protein
MLFLAKTDAELAHMAALWYYRMAFIALTPSRNSTGGKVSEVQLPIIHYDFDLRGQLQGFVHEEPCSRSSG